MKRQTLTQAVMYQFRQEYDEVRNQYEFRNKGNYEMIYPILDEITLDPSEYKMTPYQNLLTFAIKDYCRRNHVKLPPSVTMKDKLKAQEEEEKKPAPKKSVNVVNRAARLAQAAERVKQESIENPSPLIKLDPNMSGNQASPSPSIIRSLEPQEM